MLSSIAGNIANSFVRDFGRRMLNTINTAGIFLNKQKVTLNGGEDLTTVGRKEK